MEKNNIIRSVTQEDITLSVYRDNDTPATRVTAEVDGHKMVIVQDKNDNSAAVVSVDGVMKVVQIKR